MTPSAGGAEQPRRPRRRRLPDWDQYATRWTALHGGIDPRQARPWVERWLRLGYGLAKICARLRFTPTVVTLIGLVACILVPISVGHGSGGVLLASGLVLVASVTDTVDGALAVLMSRATRLGYVYDSVVDRIGEVCWLVALWRIGVPGYLAVIAGALSWLHEYARSRANAAGMTEIGAATLGERPTRVLLAFLGLSLAGLVGLRSADMPGGVATFMVAVWSVLALIGVVQLFATINGELAGRDWPTWQPPTPKAQRPTAPIPERHFVDDGIASYAAKPSTATVYTSRSVAEGFESVSESSQPVYEGSGYEGSGYEGSGYEGSGYEGSGVGGSQSGSQASFESSQSGFGGPQPVLDDDAPTSPD